MKIKRILIFWALLLWGLGICGHPAQASGEKTLTLMIYMAGSDLETQNGAATADIREMLGSGCDFFRVNILILAGGAETWHLGLNPGELSLLQLGEKGMRVLERFPLANMGEPETLTSFLSWSVSHYPAENYALIFWNHGGGPMEGVCYDELFGRDKLTLRELTEALDASPFGPERPLNWIGFDACMMASVETANVCTDYARYMIASQETEPAIGWNYSFLSRAAEDPEGDAVGRAIVDSYTQANPDNENMTLSCIELNKMGAVIRGVSELFFTLRNQLDAESFSQLSNNRRDTRSFGRVTTLSDYDLADLYHLSQQYAAQAPKEAEALQKALERAVIYNSTHQQDAHGLSIYSPYYNKDSYRSTWLEVSQDLNFNTTYQTWISRYASYWLGDQLADWSGLAGRALPAEDGRQRLELELTEEQTEHFASAKVVILRDQGYDESYFKVYEIAGLQPEDGMLRAEYDFSGLYLTDGEGRIISDIYPFFVMPEGQYALVAELEKRSFFESMVRHSRGETDAWRNRILVNFVCTRDPESDTLEVRDVVTQPEDPSELTTGKQYLSIAASEFPYIYFSANNYAYFPARDPENGGLLPYTQWQSSAIPQQNWSLIDEDGEILSVSEWSRNYEEQTVDDRRYLMFSEVDNRKPWSLQFRRDRVSPQPLYAQFIVTDTQGVESATELIPLDFPALQDSQRFDREVFRDDRAAITLESADVIRASSGSGLYLRFRIENRTDNELNFLPTNLSLNHTLIDNSVLVLPNAIPAHSTVRESVCVPVDQIPCLESRLSLIGFTAALWLSNHASEFNIIADPLQAEADLDLTALEIPLPGERQLFASDDTVSEYIRVELLDLKEKKNGTLDGYIRIVSRTKWEADISFFTHERDNFGDAIVNGCFMRDVLHASHNGLTLPAGYDVYVPFSLHRLTQLEKVGESSETFLRLFPSLDAFSYWGIRQVERLTIPFYLGSSYYLLPVFELREPLTLAYDPGAAGETEPAVPLLTEECPLSLSLRGMERTEEGVLRLRLDMQNIASRRLAFRAVDCSADGAWTDTRYLAETYSRDDIFSPGYLEVSISEGAHRVLMELSPTEEGQSLDRISSLRMIFETAPDYGPSSQAYGLDWERTEEAVLTRKPGTPEDSLDVADWEIRPAGMLPEIDLAALLGGAPVCDEDLPHADYTLRLPLSEEQLAEISDASAALVLPCGVPEIPEACYVLAVFDRLRLEESDLVADFNGLLAGMRGNDCPFQQHIYQEEGTWTYLASWLELESGEGDSLLLAEHARLTLRGEDTAAVTRDYYPVPADPSGAARFADYLEVYRIPGLDGGEIPPYDSWEYLGMVDDTGPLPEDVPALVFRPVTDWPEIAAVFTITNQDGSQYAVRVGVGQESVAP